MHARAMLDGVLPSVRERLSVSVRTASRPIGLCGLSFGETPYPAELRSCEKSLRKAPTGLITCAPEAEGACEVRTRGGYRARATVLRRSSEWVPKDRVDNGTCLPTLYPNAEWPGVPGVAS